MTFGSPFMALSSCQAKPKWPETEFRTLLNQFEGENKPVSIRNKRNQENSGLSCDERTLGSNTDGGRSVHPDRRGHLGRGSRAMSRRMRTAGAARFRASAERLVHDLLDCPCTSSALGTAAQAAINLPRRPRRLSPGDSLADVMVGKDVAGTNDH